MHSDDRLHCARCGIVFPRRHLSGRRPIYCGRTCRQRAYEARRRAAYHLHLLLPLEPPRRTDPRTLLYEAGRRNGVRHALRPDQPPTSDHRRQTLCGTHLWSMSTRRFGSPLPGLGRDCKTCAAVATAHPLAQPLDPSPDLARLKHVLLAHRGRWLAGDTAAAKTTLGQLYTAGIGPDGPLPQPVTDRSAA
jgi:hypothetical protein